uniref:Uncharacterized protein n=1 Tax=Romanomermis culicivorax TaxID=13658 RepID=A0A915HX67_ROMCU
MISGSGQAIGNTLSGAGQAIEHFKSHFLAEVDIFNCFSFGYHYILLFTLELCITIEQDLQTREPRSMSATLIISANS